MQPVSEVALTPTVPRGAHSVEVVASAVKAPHVPTASPSPSVSWSGHLPQGG
jgi:hypothetical protein